MPNQNPKDTLVHWLNDAHSMEESLIKVLENHAKDAEGNAGAARIRQHIEETRRHADLTKQCIEQLGGSVSGTKEAMGKLSGMFQGMSTGPAKDELVKNALSDYAAEHFEIAAYRSLITAARALNEERIASICEGILRDEEEMARWLETQIPTLTREHMGQPATAGVTR